MNKISLSKYAVNFGLEFRVKFLRLFLYLNLQKGKGPKN